MGSGVGGLGGLGGAGWGWVWSEEGPAVMRWGRRSGRGRDYEVRDRWGDGG